MSSRFNEHSVATLFTIFAGAPPEEDGDHREREGTSKHSDVNPTSVAGKNASAFQNEWRGGDLPRFFSLYCVAFAIWRYQASKHAIKSADEVEGERVAV